MYDNQKLKQIFRHRLSADTGADYNHRYFIRLSMQHGKGFLRHEFQKDGRGSKR
jgi:hypothetical protein